MQIVCVTTALVSALLLVAPLLPVEATKTRISPGGIECYSQTVEAGASLAFSFQVVHGGQLDLDVSLVAATIEERDDDRSRGSKQQHQITSLSHTLKARQIERWDKATEGRATFTAQSATADTHGLPTKVTACFNNKDSKWTPKWFEFQLFTDPSEPAAAEKEALATAETQLEHALHKEGNNLFGVRTMMSRLKSSETEHRAKVESTNEWVLYGTVVNGLLLMGMSVFQFWYLKKFLSVRHISMRM